MHGLLEDTLESSNMLVKAAIIITAISIGLLVVYGADVHIHTALALRMDSFQWILPRGA